jgi:hypothetical protein
MALAMDLVLHDEASAPDIERVLTNGEEPGRVVVRGAGRFGVPGRRQTTSPSVGLLDIALDLSTRRRGAIGNDSLSWPRRDSLRWPHSVTLSDGV